MLIAGLWFIGFVAFLFICGCPCGCVLCTDGFNLSDSTDINTGSPCGWTEVAGNWEILSSNLRIAAASAIATSSKVHVGSNHSAAVIFNASTASDLVRVIIDYVDTSNYHFAELKVHPTSPNGYLKVYRRSGGVDTQLDADLNIVTSTGTSYQMVVCINQNKTHIGARVTTLSGVELGFASAATTVLNGTTAGVGTGATLTGTVDFSYWQQRDVGPGCAACAILVCTYCDGGSSGYTVATMKVAFAGIVNDACTTCGTYNATFYLNNTGVLDAYCVYSYNGTPFPSCAVGGTGISGVTVSILSNFDLLVAFSVGHATYRFLADATTRVDCDELLDLPVPFEAQVKGCTLGTRYCCDWSASTCVVTSF